MSLCIVEPIVLVLAHLLPVLLHILKILIISLQQFDERDLKNLNI
jgi:hypothetical protein